MNFAPEASPLSAEKQLLDLLRNFEAVSKDF